MKCGDQTKALALRQDRERLVRLLKSGQRLSPEDHAAIIAHLAPRERSDQSQAAQLAIFYFDFLRKRALANISSGRQRLSPIMKERVAEDAIWLTKAVFKSSQITVTDLIGKSDEHGKRGRGLVDNPRDDKMQRYCKEQLATPFDDGRLPAKRQAPYR